MTSNFPIQHGTAHNLVPDEYDRRTRRTNLSDWQPPDDKTRHWLAGMLDGCGYPSGRSLILTTPYRDRLQAICKALGFGQVPEFPNLPGGNQVQAHYRLAFAGEQLALIENTIFPLMRTRKQQRLLSALHQRES